MNAHAVLYPQNYHAVVSKMSTSTAGMHMYFTNDYHPFDTISIEFEGFHSQTSIYIGLITLLSCSIAINNYGHIFKAVDMRVTQNKLQQSY